MRIIIPKPIKQELERVLKGKKPAKKRKEYSKNNLLAMANLNLDFLNVLAKTEPVATLLNKCGFEILDEFSPQFPEVLQGIKPQSGLWILKRKDGTGLYYWFNADYPANRSDRDYELIASSALSQWHNESLKRFALLTRKEVWEKIARSLSFM
jgi:hypothetical protein